MLGDLGEQGMASQCLSSGREGGKKQVQLGKIGLGEAGWRFGKSVYKPLLLTRGPPSLRAPASSSLLFEASGWMCSWFQFMPTFSAKVKSAADPL